MADSESVAAGTMKNVRRSISRSSIWKSHAF